MNKPNIQERITRFNANNEIRKAEEYKRIQTIIQNKRYLEEISQWKDRMRFDLFLLADNILEMLEEQRDRNVPKTPNEPWNKQFCEAIELLPEARKFAQDCWYGCVRKE